MEDRMPSAPRFQTASRMTVDTTPEASTTLPFTSLPW
jgi:hypothetical protein